MLPWLFKLPAQALHRINMAALAIRQFKARMNPYRSPLSSQRARRWRPAVALLLGLFALPAGAFGEFRIHAEDLSRPLMQQVRDAGLGLDSGPAIPAFQWRLELKRPLRRAREVQEYFEGSRLAGPPGMSATFRHDLPREGDATSDAVTVRGLVRVSPEDDHVGARVEGLVFPLLAGKSFRVRVRDPGIDIGQTCTVSARVAASQVHARLAGEASLIVCEGKGRYKGFDVKMTSTVYFLDVLGMFLNTQDIIESPIGVLRSSTRILDLKMGS